MNLTIVVPYWNGTDTIERLVNSLPDRGWKAIVVQDYESAPIPYPLSGKSNIELLQLDRRGYFSGACNAGISACDTDVLILNQDVWFSDSKPLDVIEENRERFGIIGDGVFGHPAWPNGYVQGTFMFIRRDVINKVGLFDQKNYPLWGATCEYQLRACRAGFEVLYSAPGLNHQERGKRNFGNAIAKAMMQEPEKRSLFLQTPPIVSVIVPCYNYGRYLPEAIESLMAQTMQSFEVIIVDDASTDDSWQIAQSLADTRKGIRAIRNKTNLGTAATINAGIKMAFGRYITILSADDKYKPDRLERLYKAALANPGKVICDDILWWTDTKTERKFMGYREGNEVRHYDFDVLLYRNHMHAGIFYPKKAWERAGGYPTIMRDGREDWAFNVALGRVGYCGVILTDYAGYIVRRQGQNRTLRNTTPEHHKKFLSTLQHLFPDAYRGDCQMCCGSGRKSSVRPKGPIAKVAKVIVPMPESPDDVELEYIGRNMGSETWYGSETGRKYKFGRNSRRITGFVAKEDAAQLLETKQFKISRRVKPHVTEVKIEPHQAPIEIEEPEEDVTEYEAVNLEQLAEYGGEATDSAKKLAQELSIDLSEIENGGKKITYHDVKRYANEIGIDIP